MDKHSLTLSSFNCRSIKNSRSEVFRLCECSYFLFLQEHWLLPDELDVLNNIHSYFYGVGNSAVELDNDIVLGRPFGGTCILYRKCLAQRVSTLVTHDWNVSKGHASQTSLFGSPAGSKAYDREMSNHGYGHMDCGTFT